MLEPRPASAIEAVARAKGLAQSVSNAANGYMLGTGNYHPMVVGGKNIDVPWTQTTDQTGLVHIGSDCAGLICWAYKLPRHRPGYNKDGQFDVEDDLNSNSLIGDAMGAHDCFDLVLDAPQPGDVIAYPTFRITKADGETLTFIGHVALVIGVSRVIEWNPSAPAFDQLDIIQICGPNGRKPAAIATDGSVFAHHNAVWPKFENRAWLLRARS